MVCCFHFVHIEYAIHSPSFHDSDILVVVLFAMRLSTTGHMILLPLNQILIRISFSYFFARMQYHDCWFLSKIKLSNTETHKMKLFLSRHLLRSGCTDGIKILGWCTKMVDIVYTSICDVTAGTQNIALTFYKYYLLLLSQWLNLLIYSWK